jgi:hypothetical protein
MGRMRPALPRSLLAALVLAGAVLAPNEAVAAANPLCTATARHPAADPRIAAAIEEARREHRLFGGQTIERNGGLFRTGYDEAEWSHAPGESTAAWQRVASFWRSLSESDPPDLMTSAGWVDRLAAEHDAAGHSGEPVPVAVREALMRAAIVDMPWSAAFISSLMKTAGFSREEFTFSDSHADYVGAAYDSNASEAAGDASPYAFRACDVATTPPRSGDLLCATRAGTASVASFEALGSALAARAPGQAFPMHCELVVRSDQGGDAKLETIGGNVVQSVTLSRMTLNAHKVLGSAYFASPAQTARCAGVTTGARCRGHLSRRPWAVVLQFRH